MKTHYRRGGLGDSIVKNRLIEVLEQLLVPIQKKRQSLDRSSVKKILQQGQEKALAKAATTLQKVRQAMGICYLS